MIYAYNNNNNNNNNNHNWRKSENKNKNKSKKIIAKKRQPGKEEERTLIDDRSLFVVTQLISY